MTVEDFRRLFRYEAWASEELLKMFAAADNHTSFSISRLAHITACGHIWLARLQGKESDLPVWPELTIAESSEKLSALKPLWEEYLHRIEDATVESVLRYRNSRGVEFAAKVGDILMHVITHGAYHRGQIAADLRAHGHSVLMTDYIVATLAGALD
jgi:uncharacterized damage-inducible protein DinB